MWHLETVPKNKYTEGAVQTKAHVYLRPKRSFCQFVCVSLAVCLFVGSPVRLCVCEVVCLLVCLSVCLFGCLSVCLYVFLSVYPLAPSLLFIFQYLYHDKLGPGGKECLGIYEDDARFCV